MAPSASSAGLLTTKRVHRLSELTLASGAVLRDVAIGYETYGTLNARRDNAVLVCHFFSGTSHAAGRYQPEDALPGWWDAVIGPGKAIDTERYFVVAIDALGCARTDAPHGVTTAPFSTNPDTGRPYGPDFPALTAWDWVASQRRVLDALGVDRLAAVAGPSLGAMQAFAWAVARPDEVDRVIAAIGPAELQAREIALYHAMEDAVRLDPKFQCGRYAPDAPPTDGLALSLKLMMLMSGGRDELNTRLGRREAGTEWAAEAWLVREAPVRTTLVDANAWIAMLRTNMRWHLGRDEEPLASALARVKARVLLLPALGDELLPMSHYHTPVEAALRAAGADVTSHPLSAMHGHLAGLADIAHAADAIRACLDTPVTR